MRIRGKYGIELRKGNFLGHEPNQECKCGFLIPDPDFIKLDSSIISYNPSCPAGLTQTQL